MATYKYIYWRPDIESSDPTKQFANVHLLQGYTNETIKHFQEMAEEMRKTFPDATDEKVRCGKVHKSPYVHGFSIIAFDAEIPLGEYPGWTECKKPGDYFW
ncbi:MAG: hypothetical protein KBC33_02390 [Candidatus Pacebacteria bacterium]|nr:hypothetical protein [Candidatus Paceibacterota bacterium]